MRGVIFNGIGLTNKEVYGIHRYTLEILRELDKLIDDKDEFYVAIPKENYTLERLKFKKIRLIKIANANNRLQVAIWNQIKFIKYAKRNNYVSVDLSLGASVLGTDVFCIHDCIRELFPQNALSYKSKLLRLLYVFQIKRIIAKSKVLLTVSEYSKKEILNYYKKSRNKNIIVIYNSWQHYSNVIPDYNILDKLQIRNKTFLLSLGSIFFHKNTKWIIDAAKNNKNYLFVVSGTKKFYFDFDEKIDNIIFTGYLSDREVKALMEKCYAFIQPSLYEGFGIPPLEAMSVGARCIVSTGGALPEIYGNSVWYINPLKYDNISIDEIMSTPIEDNSKVLEKYSWKQSAEKLLEVLKNIE